MAFTKRPSRPRTVRPVRKNCPFCKGDIGVTYKEVEVLGKYMSERGKILAHTRTGICSKHQKAVTRAIKHARMLGMMPFVGRTS